MADRNLYDYTSFFQLVIGGVNYDIQEPINWDKITIVNPRDKTSFGFNFEFVDDTVQMGFANDDVAYDLVKSIYDGVGSDGVIVFQYGYIAPNSSLKKVQLSGNVNLNTYVNEQGIITCSVEKISYENLARTRNETKISLNAMSTLDGKAIAAAPVYSVLLHSKKLSKQFKAVIDTSISATSGSLARYVSVQLDTSNAIATEIEENQSLPLGISGVDPRDEDRYFFKILEAGDYTLKVKASFNLNARRPSPISPVGNYSVVPRFLVQRGDQTIEYVSFEDFRVSGSSGSNNANLSFDFSFDLSRSWQVDDLLFLDVTGQMQYSGTTYIYNVSNYNSEIQLLGETTAAPTFTRAYRLYDALDKMIEIATGRPNSLLSSILGPGGALYKTFITNGYAIRNFTTSDKPVITSIKDCIDSISAISGLGYGFKNIGGQDFFVVEPLDKFFKDIPVIEIEEIFDFREEHAKDLVYNELEFGYNKYSEEELNSLDEFNTYQTALTPIKSYKEKFTKKASYILSGYSLETQRREQFRDNPSESLSNDDEIFMISCNENFIQTHTFYTAYPETNKLKFNRVVNLQIGTTIMIIGGNSKSNDGKSFYIISKDAGTESYNVSGDVVEFDNGNALVQQPIYQIQAEKDEIFAVVEGLFSPETSYNLRFSPKRMMFNWAKFLNIMFDKKPGTEYIKNTFVKNNDKMISMISPFDVHRRNEPLFPFGESEDISLNVFRDKKEALHLPTYYFFKSNMDYDTYLSIKEAINGETGLEKDNGFVYFRDPDYVMIKAFVYSMKYQPAEEIAEFQVAKIGNY